jgi:predicted GIY-YIG superfamily endonuclease
LNDSSILYRHFDAHGRLLYVGVAVNPKKRLLAHASGGATWVSEVSSSVYERFRTHKEVLEAEVRAIKNEGPLWNIVHSDAARLRVLRPRRTSKCASNAMFLSRPLEPCFARDGVLVSFRTRGRAQHVECTLLDNHRGKPDYQAIINWMEWFGYHYEKECVVSEDGSFCASWSHVIDTIKEDWRYEFVDRPKLGLESDFSKLRAALRKA